MNALLQRRREEFKIPAGAFRGQALFDRVLVWQIPDHFLEQKDGATFYKGTSIVMSAKGEARAKTAAPRGIIVSAGAMALDHLRSHGVDVGHIVHFVRVSPWRRPCDIDENHKEVELIVLRDSDVIASEDLAEAIASGAAEYRLNASGEHEYVDLAKGESIARHDTEQSEDY